jgi:ATP-dependent Clp protease adapter protein ClpS
MSNKKSNKNAKFELLLHDDSNISFDHVVDCLVEICGYNEIQSYQCALITNNKGQCSIFVDSFDECELVLELLTKNNLTVTMQKYKKNK